MIGTLLSGKVTRDLRCCAKTKKSKPDGSRDRRRSDSLISYATLWVMSYASLHSFMP
jgi:hypothetical protein